jgi:hypothetical protein
LDIEPNPNSGGDVVDFLVSGVAAFNNRGAGFHFVSAQGQTTRGTAVGLRARGNDGAGFSTAQTATPGVFEVTLTGCAAHDNDARGFEILAAGTVLHSPSAVGNTGHGIFTNVPTTITAPTVRDSTQDGIQVYTAGGGSVITGGHTIGNGTAANATYQNVNLYAPVTIVGHVAEAGGNANRPAYGYAVRPGVTGARLVACTSEGSYGSGVFSDQGTDTVRLLTPGSDRPAVTGSRGGNAALASLLAQLATLGLITDTTTA